MTFKISAEGVIHVEECHEADAVRYTNGGIETLDEAKELASQDFDKVRVAPCAKKVAK